jgi:hypothetical protein
VVQGVKGIGIGLEIERVQISTVSSFQEAFTLLYLHFNLADSLLNGHREAFNQPILWFLVGRNGARPITESTPTTPIMVAIWTGEVAIHPYSVYTPMIHFMKMGGI